MNSFKNIYQTALDKLTSGANGNEVLSYIAVNTERLIGDGAAVSMLVLDKQGLLRNSCSPQLPLDYLQAIDGIKPAPLVGTCAAAAATGEIVLTPDFHADDKWAELKHLPLAIGYSGAWSFPVKDRQNKVLGTFGTYYKSVRTPKQDEIEGVRLLSVLVSEIWSN
jgi:GAF domain-containing protein